MSNANNRQRVLADLRRLFREASEFRKELLEDLRAVERVVREDESEPPESLDQTLTSFRGHFILLREVAHACADQYGLSYEIDRLHTLREFDYLIALFDRFEQGHEAIEILDLITNLRHRQGDLLGPLAKCQTYARVLARKFEKAVTSGGLPELQQLLSEMDSFRAVLSLVSPPTFSDEKRLSPLNKIVSETFGSELSVALIQGDVNFQGDEDKLRGAIFARRQRSDSTGILLDGMEPRKAIPRERERSPEKPPDDVDIPRLDVWNAGLQPEIVCRLNNREWTIAVELSDEILEKPVLRVSQDGEDLMRHRRWHECWYLADGVGNIEIAWGDTRSEERCTVALDQDGCMVFKLSADDCGRLVRCIPSPGRYLVVVPPGWEYEEVGMDARRIMPQGTTIAGYSAYPVGLWKSTSGVRLVTESNTFVDIPRMKPLFRLVGGSIAAPNDPDPLFRYELPRIRARDEKSWDEIERIVVVDEGMRRVADVKPSPVGVDQILPRIPVSARYAVRLYSNKKSLWDCLDFRFEPE